MLGQVGDGYLGVWKGKSDLEQWGEKELSPQGGEATPHG